VVHRDFSILAKVYRPRLVKVIGGEPLLHKDLAAVIRAARSSGISPYFFVTTNGLLLDRMNDDVWSTVDEIEVSAYPGAEPSADVLSRARQQARERRVKFTLNRYERFRATLTTVGTQNQKLVDQIYRTCKIANIWGCHGVREGRFFKCPQSMYIPKLTGRTLAADHVPIEDMADLKDRLLAFINSPRPLSSCTYCVGTVGKKHDHVQLPRRDWPADLDRPTEEMVDYECLERSKLSQTAADDCKINADGASRPPHESGAMPNLLPARRLRSRRGHHPRPQG